MFLPLFVSMRDLYYKKSQELQPLWIGKWSLLEILKIPYKKIIQSKAMTGK